MRATQSLRFRQVGSNRHRTPAGRATGQNALRLSSAKTVSWPGAPRAMHSALHLLVVGLSPWPEPGSSD